MSSISELKKELADAKADLHRGASVVWGEGMVNYNNQLTKVTRLTNELNRLTNQGRAS